MRARDVRVVKPVSVLLSILLSSTLSFRAQAQQPDQTIPVTPVPSRGAPPSASVQNENQKNLSKADKKARKQQKRNREKKSGSNAEKGPKDPSKGE